MSTQVVKLDAVGILQQLTDKKGWKEISGLDSGTGVDFHYATRTTEACINWDQGFLTVCVDGDVVFEGTLDTP